MPNTSRLFRLKAIVQIANALAKLVKQPNSAQNGSSDFVRFNIPVHKNSILLQDYENNRFFDEERITLSDWLPCYPAKLRDISIVRPFNRPPWSHVHDRNTVHFS